VARYHFTHSLYPSVLTERVSAARRLRLHQRIGEWLEQTYGAHAGGIETHMAHHFEEARDYGRAIKHLRLPPTATCGVGRIRRLLHA
jgi:predicted ATPase